MSTRLSTRRALLRRLPCAGLGGLLLPSVLTLPALALEAGAVDKTYPEKSWEGPVAGASSGATGWSAEKLTLADAAAASLRSDAYLVVHRGRLVHGYGDITRPRNVYSVRKSVLSVLTGIEVDRGVIDLDQSLADMNVDDLEGLTAQEKTATWRHLLQSKSGVYHPAAYETRDAKAQRPTRGSHAPALSGTTTTGTSTPRAASSSSAAADRCSRRCATSWRCRCGSRISSWLATPSSCWSRPRSIQPTR